MPTLTLQPPETDPTNRDTFIADAVYVNTNFDGWGSLNVGTQSLGKGTQALFRTILRFDLTSLIGATITDATLILSAAGGNVTGETVTVHRLTQPNWTELGVTWNVYDGTNNWATAGGDFDPTPAQALVIASVQDLVFDDLQALVKDAIELRGGMLDVLVKGAATSGLQILEFYSSGDATPSKRPTLIVNYDYPVWCVESGDSPEYVVEIYDEAC